MFIIGNLLSTIAGLASMLISLYSLVIIISSILSWVNPDPYNPFVRTLRALTEPVYYQVRRFLPFTMSGGFDFSPFVVLIALWLIDGAIISSIAELAHRL